MHDVTDLVMIDPVSTGFSKPLRASSGVDDWITPSPNTVPHLARARYR